jgi:hypothetical protein
MITFDGVLDIRTREPSEPTVARIQTRNGQYLYCVIGTEYGHLHTTGGDVRTWGSYSGAKRARDEYARLKEDNYV